VTPTSRAGPAVHRHHPANARRAGDHLFRKVIIWDKVLGLGTTDPITGMVADWTGLIVTAYVGGRSIEKVARIFRR
jgi:hypothetical protein